MGPLPSYPDHLTPKSFCLSFEGVDLGLNPSSVP